MAITLDGVPLPYGPYPGMMIWGGEHKPRPVSLDSATTIGGRYRYAAKKFIGGREIDLVAEINRAWIDQATLDALNASHDANVGNSITLDWNGTIYTVIYRYDDAPAIDMTPVSVKVCGNFYGTIKLREVA